MRRMREFSKRYFWFAVPAGVAIIAIGTAKFVLGPDTSEKKPSKYAEAKARELEERRKAKQKGSDHEESDDASEEASASAHASNKKQSAGPAGEEADSHASRSVAEVASGESSVCGANEIPGAGTSRVKASPEQWTKVMSEFHQAKRELVSWVDSNRVVIGQSGADEMIKHLKEIRIHRPPQLDEPDLDWRGIGAYSRDVEGAPMIKIGGGFISMMEREPQRARFELTRLLAQGWSPCELKRDGLKAMPWKPLLDCLKLPSDGDAACPNTEVSDAGWAVSTSVAFSIATPGCRVPAMNDPQLSACMARPLPPAKGEALKLKESAETRPLVKGELHSEVRR